MLKTEAGTLVIQKSKEKQEHYLLSGCKSNTKNIIPSLGQLLNINIKTQLELVGVGLSATCHTVSGGVTLQQARSSAITTCVCTQTQL